MSKQKTIVVVAGYWSTNIGNSFFQLGAEYILKQIFPNDNVAMLCDQPGFFNVKTGNPENAFNLLNHINPDYLVILGPFLRLEYDRIWSKTLRLLAERKVKVVILGAGMMRYSAEEINKCRKLLSETPPFIFASRDTDTYKNFSDISEYSYDGIDLAFFVSDIFKSVSTDLGKYIILNFDQLPEPKITISKKIVDIEGFEFKGKKWELEFPPLRYYLSQKFKFYPFFEAFLPVGNYPKKIGDYMVIRTDHRFNPMLLKKIYKGTNSFVSDVPYTYLNLYANTSITLSNRVHACVATLAFGNPAMLFTKTPRIRLLERVGLNQITKKPLVLPKEKIDSEKRKLLEFLKGANA